MSARRFQDPRRISLFQPLGVLGTSYVQKSKKKLFLGPRWFMTERCMRSNNVIYNRPFYRYGGHIELIRFKEYYRMPRGMSTFRLYFRALFGTFFLTVFLE